MALDLILRHALLASAGPEQPTVDIGVHNGLIVAVEPQLTAEGPAYDVGGKLVSPGLIESHFQRRDNDFNPEQLMHELEDFLRQERDRGAE